MPETSKANEPHSQHPIEPTYEEELTDDVREKFSSIINENLEQKAGLEKQTELRSIHIDDFVDDSIPNVPDGFYYLSGLGRLSRGNIIRISTSEAGKKLLWYPTEIMSSSFFEKVILYAAKKSSLHHFHQTHSDRVNSEEYAKLAKQYFKTGETEYINSLQVIDFGSGDMRIPLIAGVHGIPAVGFELDPVFLELAKKNIKDTSTAHMLKAPVDLIQKSFFDKSELRRVLKKLDRKNLCYLYINPITWEVVQTILEYLSPGDIIVTYKYKLSEDEQKWQGLCKKFPTMEHLEYGRFGGEGFSYYYL